MTQTDIARRESAALAQSTIAAPMTRLDPYAPGGIAPQAGRLAPLAIVSLGFRQQPKEKGALGLPRATRREDDRWLHLHDPDNRAPGLAAALEDGNYRRLTVALPLDDPRAFIQQSFTRWSASALQVYGDASGLTVIEARDPNNPVHRLVPAGDPEFDRQVRTCKAETRMYFALAEWEQSRGPNDEPQSRVLFPDGFGFYCFRTAGRHTAAEIMGYLESFRTFTRGRLAGIPFELHVVFREVAGPDGKKRTVPVANIVARPPEHLALDSKTFRVLAIAGLEEGRNLQLPALPSAAELAAEGPPDLEEVPPEAMERLAAGDSPCDYDLTVRTWHAIVRGTPLESDDARAEWLSGWSKGEFSSLTAVRRLTQREATQLLADLADGISDVREELEQQRRAEFAAKYRSIFGSDDEGNPAPVAAQGEPVVSEEVANPPASSDAPAVDDPAAVDEALAKNAALVEDARGIGVKGLGPLTAKPGWSLAKIEEANTELGARMRSRSGELDDAAAAEQARAF